MNVFFKFFFYSFSLLKKLNTKGNIGILTNKAFKTF